VHSIVSIVLINITVCVVYFMRGCRILRQSTVELCFLMSWIKLRRKACREEPCKVTVALAASHAFPELHERAESKQTLSEASFLRCPWPACRTIRLAGAAGRFGPSLSCCESLGRLPCLAESQRLLEVRFCKNPGSPCRALRSRRTRQSVFAVGNGQFRSNVLT